MSGLPWKGDALVKSLMNLGELVDIIERIAHGGYLPVSVEELAEVILGGQVGSGHAQALLTFSHHPDKMAAWKRFARSSERVYGPDWRERIKRIHNNQTKLQASWVFSCSKRGCMELAWGHKCDQCLIE
jgi:hypothetical protein